MISLSGYLVFFLLFLLQFVVLPMGYSNFESPKVYVAEIGIFLLLLVFIFRSGDKNSHKLLSKVGIKKFLSKDFGVRISLLFIVLFSLIHLFFFQTSTTLFGNEFRMQGMFLLWLLLAFSIISSKIILDKLLLPYIIFGLLFFQLIFSLLIGGEGYTRAIGTLGEPNALAACVLFLWPFIYFSKKEFPLWLKLLSLGFVFILIFISGSRSGMIAFVAQMIFILFLRTKLSISKGLILSLIALLGTYILPFVQSTGLYEQRSEIWQVAWHAGLQSPIIGNGFGNMDAALKQSIIETSNHLKGYYVDSSHNIFLDWWVQGGIVGLGLFLFLLMNTFKQFVVQKNVFYITLLLGLVASLSFNPASVVSLVALWWVIGQSFV